MWKYVRDDNILWSIKSNDNENSMFALPVFMISFPGLKIATSMMQVFHIIEFVITKINKFPNNTIELYDIPAIPYFNWLLFIFKRLIVHFIIVR